MAFFDKIIQIAFFTKYTKTSQNRLWKVKTILFFPVIFGKLQNINTLNFTFFKNMEKDILDLKIYSKTATLLEIMGHQTLLSNVNNMVLPKFYCLTKCCDLICWENDKFSSKVCFLCLVLFVNLVYLILWIYIICAINYWTIVN